MSKIRKNLMVGIDNRTTGDHEVIILKTTSTEDMIIEINAPTNKMSINIEDFQNAIDELKEFNKNRPVQPVTMKPFGVADIETSGIELEKIERLEKEIMEFGN